MDIDSHSELLDLVRNAHYGSAMNNNCVSSVAMQIACSGSDDFLKGVVSAISSFGSIHGPAGKARDAIYKYGKEEIAERVSRREKIPGWGNSFFKDRIDPQWNEVDNVIRKHYPDHAKILDEKTQIVFEATDRDLKPNAAAYTAIASEIAGLPSGLEMLLVVQGRLSAWAEMFLAVREQGKQKTGE